MMNQSLWIRFIHPRGIARSERLDGGKGPDVLVPVVFDEKGWTRMKRWGNLFNFNMVGCSAEKGPMACGCLWLKWLYINPRWNLGGEGYFPWCRYLLAGYNPQQYRKQNPLKKIATKTNLFKIQKGQAQTKWLQKPPKEGSANPEVLFVAAQCCCRSRFFF